MQIIPTSTVDGAYGFFSNLDTNSQSGANFMSAMNDAISAVDNGEYISAEAALENEQPLVESPYTRHTTDGVTYTLSEVCFTKNELQELRKQLVKEGAPEESLRQFDILADQPNGATLAQVMASLIGKSSASQLDEDDEHAITALLGQIDPSGQLAVDALDLMRGGNPAGALDLIGNALGKMGSDEGINVDAESLLALGKGLGLSTDSQRLLLAGMRGSSSLTVNASQFDTLLNPAKNQIMTDAANAEKLDAALEKTLKPIIAKARDRMEKEKAASELQSRRVEQSKILIDRSVQENSREILEGTVTGEAEAPGNANHIDGREIAHLAQKEPQMQAGREAVQKADNSANARNSESAANVKAAVNAHLADARGMDNDAGQNGDSDILNRDKADAWQNLLGKVETRPAATSLNSGSSIVYSMLQGSLAEEPYMAASELFHNEAILSQRLASQVEQGMLTAMRDGATRLDLQLHPAELGAITITLIARNGEVTAQLKSERSETAEIISRQLDTMRVNLEQQGIRVDKIEVQLENKQDNLGNSFQDLSQHNARQEEDARRQELNRLRNLASIRNNRINSEDTVLAQPVHNMARMASYAGTGLYVVA